jgi:serine/threonine-protein kinase SRPK3
MTSVFPEEDLLATGADGQGFFITRPGFGLKAGRYTIKRKIGRGSYSSTYLVFDEQEK